MAVLLYTPTVEDAGGFTGGALCIKTRSGQAYIGFATESLAKAFRARRKIPDSVTIIPASELGGRFPMPAPLAAKVVLFSTPQILNAYFADPQAFPCEDYFVDLSSLRNP
jgi:hypothetical protein